MPSVGSPGFNLTPVSVTAAYTAAAGQLVLANAASATFTVTLPASPVAGTIVTVKKTDASQNNVTVVPTNSSNLIDGDTSCVISGTGTTVQFVYDSANGAWRISSTALTAVGTDSVQNLWTVTYLPTYWYDRRGLWPITSNTTNVAPGTAGSAYFGQSAVNYVPHYQHRAVSIDQVAICTGTTTPTSGATVRIGLYTNSASTNSPSTLLYDWGVVAPTAASTAYNISASGTIPAGWSWFAVSLNATNVGSLQILPSTSNCAPQMGLSSPNATTNSNSQNQIFYQSGTGAALAATASPTAVAAAYQAGAVNVWFRVLS